MESETRLIDPVDREENSSLCRPGQSCRQLSSAQSHFMLPVCLISRVCSRATLHLGGTRQEFQTFADIDNKSVD